MSYPRRPKQNSRRFGEERRRAAEAEQRWSRFYPPEIVERLRADSQYWLVRVNDMVYAYSSYDEYVAALKEVWGEGLMPNHAPGPVWGADLPAAAPRLEAVNPETSELLKHNPQPEP